MREYPGIPAFSMPDPKAPDFTNRLRNALGTLDIFLRDVSFSIARIDAGERPSGGGEPIGGGGTFTGDHGDLTGLGDDDHAQYALLAGRSGGQTFNGSNDTSGLLTLVGGTSSVASVKIRPNTTSAQMLTVYRGGTVADILLSGANWYLSTEALSMVNTSAVFGIWTQNSLVLNALAGGTKAALGVPAGVGIAGDVLDCIHANSANTGDFFAWGLNGSFNELAPSLSAGQKYGRVLRSGQMSLNPAGLLGTGVVPIVVFGSSGHTASLQEWANSSATVLALVTADGYFSSRQFWLNGSTSGTCKVVPAAVTTDHTLTLPSANAVGGLVNDGAGALSWAATQATYSSDLAGQTANIGSTTMVAAGTAGVYRLEFYIVAAVSVAGTITLTLTWNDGRASQTSSPLTAVALTALGNPATVSTMVYADGSAATAFSTTVGGTLTYDIHVRATRV